MNRLNFYDYVGGPGDGFMSVGPGGMSSEEHQRAIAEHEAQQASEESIFGFFGGVFDDEQPEVLTAEEGAVDAAAQAAIDFANEAAQAPSGGGSRAPSASPPITSSSPVAPSEGIASSSSGGKSNLLLFGAIAGVAAFFLLGK